MEKHDILLEPAVKSNLGFGMLPSQQMDTTVNRHASGLRVPCTALAVRKPAGNVKLAACLELRSGLL